MDLTRKNICGLTRQQRERVDALLDELLDLNEEKRVAALRATRNEDSVVVAEVESLLLAAHASEGFLTRPARPSPNDVVPDAAIGIRLGAWTITRLIGRGGMGEVYEAIRAERDFEQRVAIKLLRHEAGAQGERFQAERQILARLEHPGIARLYDGGITSDHRPFMVMEYVEGRSITDFCAQRHAPLEQRLALFIQVCDAVAYAHRNLIVHRDLKPSNILVTTGGQVKLLDFGVAKLLDPQLTRLTGAAVAPLTPICAAPEQLTGAPITTATDVYALGVLLFELLTAAHPWIESDMPMLQAMRTVLQRSAPLASRMAETGSNAPVPARLIRGDLDSIVAKALRAEPAHRYATVESLKSDVDRVLRGAPVEAREGARLYVLGHMLRRHRWSVAAGAAVFIVLAVGWGVSARRAQLAALERDVARREVSREEAVRNNLTRLFRSAIADRSAQPGTPQSMVDSSARLALRELQDQPELAGQIVVTMPDMYGAVDDVTGAASLLEGFVAQSDPLVDPAALADARQKLADIELLRGQTEYAGQLLDQANSFWASSPRPYREERLQGLIVRARLLRARGDLGGAIAATQQAIAQRVELSGREHRETATLENFLAILLTADNRLDEALAAYHETTAIYRALGLGDGIEAQIVMANNGILELRLGHLKLAELLLKTAASRERSLAGDSAPLAAAMGYYGKVLSITNRNELAIGVLRQAAQVASRSAGPDSPLALQNRLFLAEVQLAIGDLTEANETLNAVRVAAAAQFGAADPLSLRTQVALAQLAAADGQLERARAQLLPLIAALRARGVACQAHLAQALEILGDVEFRNGQTAQANAALQEAVALREKISVDTWELAEARERLGETSAKSGSDAAAGLLETAFRQLELQLGADHPETRRAKAALAHLHVSRTA